MSFAFRPAGRPAGSALEARILYFFALAFLMAGMVKGLLGMGLPLVSITLMSILIEPKVAIPFVLASGIVLNLVQVIQVGGVLAVTKRFTSLAIAAAVGVWVGTELLFAVDPRVIEILLGIIVCGYVFINIIRIPPTLPKLWENRLSIPAGLVFGVLQGATGSLAAPLAAWWQMLGLKKDEFVQASGYVLLIVVIPWSASLIVKGAVTWRIAFISAGLMIPAAVGMYLGGRIRARVPEERYRNLILALLFFAGLVLLGKGVAS
ncbi:MAG: sulfite exporter TauE/SafE family protein [Rhodospirillaceae bacterium]|nr:sulfite exporter TauE/SafE family protein [Rhodospirillaceae bacterium]